jgi:glycosyltransferase involved in cell wall biosynthesis
MSEKSLSVILPAHNEELTVARVIRDFHDALPGAALWVVDNASTDKTKEIALSEILRLGCKGGVLSEQRKGKGNALRAAFHSIESDFYVVADADMTYPAAMAKKLLPYVLENHADLVVGDRISGGDYGLAKARKFHGFGNRLVVSLVNMLFRSELRDIMSGLRVMNRKFVQTYPIMVEGFQIETDMALHALDKRFRILEVPIRYLDRPEGSLSKLNTVRDGLKVLNIIFQIFRAYKPMIFFGSLAGTLSILSLGAGLPVITEWLQTGEVLRIPSAVLAIGFGISALVLFAIALILESFVHQSKREFELRLLAL